MGLVDFSDPQIVNAVSGALAGALTATFVCPLDVLKTRLQVSRLGALKDVGIYGGLVDIAKREGVKGLYRGLTPSLMALLPNWAVYFTVYDSLKERIANRPDGRRVPPTVASNMLAAAGAGAATLAVTNPLWVVKTRLQTQTLKLNLGRPTAYKSTLHALATIARTEGIAGLYSGLAPSMMGLLHVAIQLPLYEAAKLRVSRERGCSPDELRAPELVLTSAFSKMVASTATYPHEVIRSYMHVTGSGPLAGLADACRTILREDGVRGFYRGCATNLLRTTPAAALTFTSFELISRFLRGVNAAAAAGEAGPASAATGAPRLAPSTFSSSANGGDAAGGGNGIPASGGGGAKGQGAKGAAAGGVAKGGDKKGHRHRLSLDDVLNHLDLPDNDS